MCSGYEKQDLDRRTAAASVGFADCLILPVSSADVESEDWTKNLALSKQISVIPDSQNPQIQGSLICVIICSQLWLLC